MYNFQGGTKQQERDISTVKMNILDFALKIDLKNSRGTKQQERDISTVNMNILDSAQKKSKKNFVQFSSLTMKMCLIFSTSINVKPHPLDLPASSTI